MCWVYMGEVYIIFSSNFITLQLYYWNSLCMGLKTFYCPWQYVIRSSRKFLYIADASLLYSVQNIKSVKMYFIFK
jgi:hypothetical protein